MQTQKTPIYFHPLSHQVSGAYALGTACFSLHNQYKKIEKSDPMSLAMNGALALLGGSMIAQGFRK